MPEVQVPSLFTLAAAAARLNVGIESFLEMPEFSRNVAIAHSIVAGQLDFVMSSISSPD